MNFPVLGKRARSLSRSIRRTFGREVSDSEYDSDYDGQLSPYNREEDPEYIETLGKPTRARSPTRMQSDYAERKKTLRERRTAQREQAAQQMLLQRQALDFTYNHEVDEIIGSINQYLSNFFGEEVNIDIEDPSIRFIVGMIVTSNGARINVYQKLRRSRLLLTSIASFIISRATRGALNIGDKVAILLPFIRRGIAATGSLLLRLGAASGRAAKRTAYSVATSMRNYFTPRQQADALEQGRAASPPRQSIHEVAQNAYNYVATGLPDFFSALSDILQQVYVLLAPCVNTGASMAVSLARSAANAACAYFTPQQAVAQAVEQVVPEERNLECSICMTDAVLGQGAVVTNCNHRYHGSCIDEWFRLSGNRDKTCPYCRTIVTETIPPQSGGGLKKYRSKTRTKSRSKSRRYLSKPQKSRKARKRVRHSSSRRK